MDGWTVASQHSATFLEGTNLASSAASGSKQGSRKLMNNVDMVFGVCIPPGWSAVERKRVACCRLTPLTNRESSQMMFVAARGSQHERERVHSSQAVMRCMSGTTRLFSSSSAKLQHWRHSISTNGQRCPFLVDSDPETAEPFSCSCRRSQTGAEVLKTFVSSAGQCGAKRGRSWYVV